jgi:hypothetical protein
MEGMELHGCASHGGADSLYVLMSTIENYWQRHFLLQTLLSSMVTRYYDIVSYSFAVRNFLDVVNTFPNL